MFRGFTARSEIRPETSAGPMLLNASPLKTEVSRGSFACELIASALFFLCADVLKTENTETVMNNKEKMNFIPGIDLEGKLTKNRIKQWFSLLDFTGNTVITIRWFHLMRPVNQ